VVAEAGRLGVPPEDRWGKHLFDDAEDDLGADRCLRLAPPDDPGVGLDADECSLGPCGVQLRVVAEPEVVAAGQGGPCRDPAGHRVHLRGLDGVRRDARDEHGDETY
jgi:hypothetical protein